MSPDQTGFMADRFIGENIRLRVWRSSRSKHRAKRGILLLIDFEKGLYSVSWSFIHKSLRYLNFPENILNWIKLFDTK